MKHKQKHGHYAVMHFTVMTLCVIPSLLVDQKEKVHLTWINAGMQTQVGAGRQNNNAIIIW